MQGRRRARRRDAGEELHFLDELRILHDSDELENLNLRLHGERRARWHDAVQQTDHHLRFRGHDGCPLTAG